MERPKIETWDGKTKPKYIHLKYDGHFTSVRKCCDESIEVWTRRPTNITEKVKHQQWMAPFYRNVPKNTIVFGELYSPGKDSSQVKTAINNNTVKFMSFAIATYDRRAELEQIEMMALNWGLSFAYFERFNGESPEELMDRCTQEGFVLKDGNLVGWKKLKPVRTLDLLVTNVTYGVKRGLIAGLVCSGLRNGKLVEVASVSGMDLEECARFTQMVEEGSLSGMIIEVRYQNVGTNGRLRHPRFIRVREDKTQPDEV